MTDQRSISIQVRDLLGALPILPNIDRGKQMEREIRALCFRGGVKGRYSRVMAEPNFQTKSPKAAAVDLAKLARAGENLREAIRQLPRNAVLALGNGRALWQLSEDVEELLDAILRAKIVVLTEPSAVSRGAKSNAYAMQIAREAARSYSRLTGKKAKVSNRLRKQSDPGHAAHEPSGHFYDLVAGLFRVFEINANPEHYASRASKGEN